MKPVVAIAALFFIGFAGAAQAAEPCDAVKVQEKAPAWLRPGKVFTGTVRYVGDGDMICVGRSPDPRTWVEVRLADFYAPEMKEPDGPFAAATLRRLTLGKSVVCVAGRKNWDRIIARCTISGRSIGDMMRAARVREGGRGWPPPTSSRRP